jgi:hypothetical protein
MQERKNIPVTKRKGKYIWIPVIERRFSIIRNLFSLVTDGRLGTVQNLQEGAEWFRFTLPSVHSPLSKTVSWLQVVADHARKERV